MGTAGHTEYLEAQLASLPPLPQIERLTPRVIRVLGGNPSPFHLQGTNTYLIGTGRNRLLVDTGQGFPIWIESLSKVLTDEKAIITQTLLTHWHLDHVEGVHDLRKLSPATKYYKNSPDDGVQLGIQDGQVFKVDGATLRAVHTPGHTVDHMCFVFEEEDAIFTGDNVLGHGTSVFEVLGAYMKSLQKMLDQGTKGVAYPGHGAVIERSGEKINEYILHRERREDQVLGVLLESLRNGKKDGDEGNEGLGVMEIVDEIYPSIDSELRLAAGRGIMQVLKKLEDEGRVGMREHAGETKWFLRERPNL